VLDVNGLLLGAGPWAIGVIALLVFIESGVLFPFLPGDSLLITAGILHGKLGLTIPLIAGVGFLAAAAGDQVGYWLGHRFGRRMFKDDAKILKTSRLVETERFFERYGGASLVLGRFVPVVRTYVPLAAGSAGYRYRRFLVWNLTGAFLWAVGVTLAGTALGKVPFIRDNLEVLLVVVVAVSVLPVGIGALRKRAKARAADRSDGAQGAQRVDSTDGAAAAR
jgi:membrane-associated protein